MNGVVIYTYGTAQMQRRALTRESIASAWIIADWGAWHLPCSQVLLPFLVGATKTSATPLWSAIIWALAIGERERVRRCIWAVP